MKKNQEMKKRQEKGFTLLELAIAMLIIMVFAVCSWIGVSHLTRAGMANAAGATQSLAAPMVDNGRIRIPTAPVGRVADYAGILLPEERNQINRKLRNFEQRTNHRMVIAIFPSLYQEDLNEFTHRLAETWGLGDRQENDGVLLAVFLNERVARIEVGYGLEAQLPDAVCRRIIQDGIVRTLEDRRTIHFDTGSGNGGSFGGGGFAGLSHVVDQLAARAGSS